MILAGVQFELAHPAYELSMGRLYKEVAARTGVTFIPDLLDGVSGSAEMNQADRIHPNAQGQRALAAAVVPVLQAELRSLPEPAI